VVNTKTWTAIRTDCALTRAHGGAQLATRPDATFAVKPINGVSPMSAFSGVPSAYVAEQESHPPRERSVG
jgi:hypothetical protein